MNEKQAHEWLMQPGIKATLLHYDKDTNAALEVAIKNLLKMVKLKDMVEGTIDHFTDDDYKELLNDLKWEIEH